MCVRNVTDGNAILSHVKGMERNTHRVQNHGLVMSLALVLMISATAVLPAEQAAKGAPTDALVSGMVAFDRAYIPALALSSQNKPAASLAAMNIMKEQWSSFERQFGAFSPEKDWQQGLDNISAALLRSEERLKAGDAAAAHAALEEVRDIFVRLREQRSIPYYVDFLNHYHESMEKVTAVTAGRTAATLEEEQLRQVGSLLPDARRRWEATLAAPFDAGLHGFPPGKTDELMKAEQAVLAGIVQVEQALRDGDRAALVRTVEAMKPVFTRTFLMFGDFERVPR
jgi:hypothetical protein